jgi:6-pyruvoyltetrahydropterin/6-carboxytetrahydropterin synthase
MITVTRKLEFDAGHRVMNHESKCATLHGHRYVVEVTATAPELDLIGRVIDFSVLKARIGSWLDHNWDHTTILWDRDAETVALVGACPQFKPPFVAPFNPTAENMARYLLLHVCPLLMADTGVEVTKIRMWETPNCYAEVAL